MRALCALAFCAFSVAAVLYLPGAGWAWALLAALLVAALLTLAVYLRRRGGRPMAALALALPGGRVALWLLTAWNLLILGVAAGHLCAAYQTGTPWPIVGVVLLLMASWSAANGSAERVGAISFYFLAALYGLLLLFALPQAKPAAPSLRVSAWVCLPGALSPLCALWLWHADAGRARLWPWLLGGVALAGLSALVCAGAAGHFPFYTMAQSLRLFGVVERFEPIVSVGLTAGGFCLLALLCRVNGCTLGVLAPRWGVRAVACVNFLAGCVGILLSARLLPQFLAAGTAIFWGALPLGILLVANFKKSRKK